MLDLLSRFQATAAAARKELARAGTFEVYECCGVSLFMAMTRITMATERRILRKYLVKREPGLVVLRTSFQDDPEMFDELRNRIFSDLIMEVGSKDTPPRLEAVIHLIRELDRLDIGKRVTLGGCCVRSARSALISDAQRQRRLTPFVGIVTGVGERKGTAPPFSTGATKRQAKTALRGGIRPVETLDADHRFALIRMEVTAHKACSTRDTPAFSSPCTR